MKYLNFLTPCFCYDEKSAEVVLNLPKETGFDRVKRMYQTNVYGLMSPEMHYLMQNATTTVMISAIVGAVIHGYKVKDNYFRKHAASTFESQHLARRHLVDTVTLSVIKGGLKYAWKYGSFSTIYLLSTMTAANYNNKITIWEHIGTGAALGGILRIQFGFKGMAVSAGLGGVLGAFAGGVIVLMMKLNNCTLDDIHNWETAKYYDMRRQIKSESV